MTVVQYADISQLGDGQYKSLYDRASPERKHRADRYLRKADSCRCIVAEALLRHALGCSEFQVKHTPAGKPYLPEKTEFHFNLSHSGRWVAIAYSDSPVGIDVEQYEMDAGKEQLAIRFFTSDEQAYLFSAREEQRAKRFYEIWTKKESYLKYLGTGIDRPLNSFSVLKPLEIRFFHYDLKDAAMTLCGETGEVHCSALSLDVLEA
jgi:4'-phosphopantetheinyl transferase